MGSTHTTETSTTIEPSSEGPASALVAGKAKRRRRRRARGSTYQRSDGRWCGELALKGGGRKFVYGKSQAEAEQKLTAAKATIDQGGKLVSDRLTVGELFDAFLEERTPRVRANTIDSYRYIIDSHLRPHLGKLQAVHFGSDELQAFLNKCTREKMSASMVKHLVDVLRMAFKLAVARRRITFNPTEGVHGPKVECNVKEPLGADDAQKMLAVARAHELGAMWFLAASLGLRHGEVAGLRWRDVDLDGGMLHVRHQLYIARQKKGETLSVTQRTSLVPPKTKRAVRSLALSPAIVALLKARKKLQAADKLKAGEAWEDKLALIFTTARGQPIDRGTRSKMHREMLKQAKVRHVRYHDLRHGAATLMLAAGVDPATLSATLGHSRVAFTLDTYVHATSPRIDDAVGKLAAILGA